MSKPLFIHVYLIFMAYQEDSMLRSRLAVQHKPLWQVNHLYDTEDSEFILKLSH